MAPLCRWQTRASASVIVWIESSLSAPSSSHSCIKLQLLKSCSKFSFQPYNLLEINPINPFFNLNVPETYYGTEICWFIAQLYSPYSQSEIWLDYFSRHLFSQNFLGYFYRIFICILLYTVDTPSPEEIRPGYYGYLCGVVLPKFRGITKLIDQVAMTTTATAATTTGSRRPCPCSRGIDL